jgi:DHA3 family macrolide efflux protein-like MFS transporter
MSVAPIQAILFIDVATATIGISILYFLVKIPAAEDASAEDVVSEGTATRNEDEDDTYAEDAATENADNEQNSETKGMRSYWHEIRSSLTYIRTNSFVLRLILYSGIASILITPCAMLTPLQVARDFGPDVWRLTAIEIAFSVGMIIGGLTLSAWGGFKNKVKTTGLGLVLFGLGTAALGLLTNFPLYIAVMAFIGITTPLVGTPIMSLLQAKVDPEHMGRVFSFFTMMSSIAMPIGMLIFGPLADVITIDIMLIITGLAGLAEVAFISFDKEVIRAGK